jgi:hypothetical protein
LCNTLESLIFMKMEFEIPENVAKEMKRFPKIDWNNIVSQAINGCINDFTILDKLKEFWGIERKKEKKKAN